MPSESAHIELTWLEDFLALCESGNFTRAAERRHLTQPAFSRRIRLLEEWIDAELFDRTAHPIELTEAGHQFRPVAQEILSKLVLARDAAQALKSSAGASLRFAATHVLSLTFFPAWLRGLEERLQLGPIHLVSNTLQACEELMLSKRVHFLICHFHPASRGRLDLPEFQSKRIGVDTLIPVVDSAHMRKHGPGWAVTELPILDYSAESGLGRIVRAIRQRSHQPLRAEPRFTSHLATVLKAMVLDQRGIAWLPRSLIADDLANGRVVDLHPQLDQIDVEIHLFRRKDRDSPIVESLWACVA